jgi:hypothetical protein
MGEEREAVGVICQAGGEGVGFNECFLSSDIKD